MKIGIVGSRRRNSNDDKIILTTKICELISIWYSEKYLRCECVDITPCHPISAVIEKMKKHYNEITIVTGDCDEGGDEFARRIACELPCNLDIKKIKHPKTGEEMDFKHHPWFPYYEMCEIFYARDEEIAKEDLDYLVCLVAEDRKGGTEKTIQYFKYYNPHTWEEKLVII